MWSNYTTQSSFAILANSVILQMLKFDYSNKVPKEIWQTSIKDIDSSSVSFLNKSSNDMIKIDVRFDVKIFSFSRKSNKMPDVKKSGNIQWLSIGLTCWAFEKEVIRPRIICFQKNSRRETVKIHPFINEGQIWPVCYQLIKNAKLDVLSHHWSIFWWVRCHIPLSCEEIHKLNFRS